MSDEDDDLTVMVPLSRKEALGVANFLIAYGDDDGDRNIAEHIRYMVKQAEATNESA